MAIEGYVDEAKAPVIAGWVYDSATPDAPLTVEIVHAGQVVSTAQAANFRPDLVAAGKGNGCHGFYVNIGPSPGTDGRVLFARVKGQHFYLPGGHRAVGPREQAAFNHSLEFGMPEVDHGFTPEPLLRDEAACIGRLIDAFTRAAHDDPQGKRQLKDMWSDLKDSLHGPFLALIERRDRQGVAAYLRNVHARPLTHGITIGELAGNALRTDANMARVIAAQYADRLTSLAEYLGTLRPQCPEQASAWATLVYLPVAETVAAVERALGFGLAPENPPCGNFGLNTTTGILSDRDLQALYAALRLVEVGRIAKIERPAVVEIGGGAAGVAYYAHRLGLRSYTIIDLPLINLLQGYCLMCGLGPDAVTLYGEPPRPGTIRVMPTWTLEKDEHVHDVMLNQDSFPEMHTDYSTGYLRTARKKVRHFLLSINQEAAAVQTVGAHQSVVADLVRTVGGYTRLNRSRHWLRPGYVEEVYRVG